MVALLLAHVIYGSCPSLIEQRAAGGAPQARGSTLTITFVFGTLGTAVRVGSTAGATYAIPLVCSGCGQVKY